jgi:hypothetical protein
MGSIYLKGERALERLGDVTELICIEAEKKGLDQERRLVLDGLMERMGGAISERNIKKAKELVITLLTDVLDYEPRRAKFVMNNHLNKNAGWE